ncbi:hypothetical protein SLEP1_g23283 [Rubroshorea leprosula]|uniref:DUF4283 domain-containing protein n=1 Tax=Rubroshorea leprosula TaxID=152421 RepID=A0AAV5JNX8_9ROSI|nr:hypothetical protein SLEP1_g23283 [Rubroshorea leprosula]
MRGRERKRERGPRQRTQSKRIAQRYESFNPWDRGQFRLEVGVYDRRIYNQAIPFFFTNFPEEWSFEQMWQTFNRLGLGRVLEIDCPKKKDRFGKRFGRTLATNLCLKAGLNMTLTAESKRPSYAEVVLGQSRRKYERPMARRREEGPTRKMGGNETDMHGRQQWQWKPKHHYHQWSGMEINIDKDEYAWLEKCYVGTVHSVSLIPNLQEKFFMEGVFFCNIRPMGGRLVLLEGKDYEDLKELVDTGKDWMGQWFEDVKPWSPATVATERFAWIWCQGLPAHAWKLETFQTFRNLWGNFITLDDSTSYKRRFDAACFLITTPSPDSIFRSFTTKINGKFFILKFTEEESTNSLFTMRSDRVIHAPSDVDDEKSCSLESSTAGDLDLEVDMMEQAKLQSVEGEGDGAEAISEDDVVMLNAVDVNGAKVISRDDEVASYCVEPNCSTKMGVEIVRTGTEVVEESKDMGENLNGPHDSNSNASRLGEAKKVGVHLETPVNIAEQGDVGNTNQMSKNVAVDSYDMSNQNNNIEVSGMGCGVGRQVRSLRTGMGLKMVIGPNCKAEIGLHGTSIADPMEQSTKNDRKSKLKNRNWCIAGDFNAIRNLQERKGGRSVRRELKEFNDFIEMSSLVELPMIGRKFTWYQPNGQSMSRLDRIGSKSVEQLRYPRMGRFYGKGETKAAEKLFEGLDTKSGAGSG